MAAQALAIRTVFSGVYLDWLDTADGFRWHATRRIETIEPKHNAALRRFQRGWRKSLRERKEAAEAAEAQVSSGVEVVRTPLCRLHAIQRVQHEVLQYEGMTQSPAKARIRRPA